MTSAQDFVAGDINHPPSRDGLSDAEAWVHDPDRAGWARTVIAPDVEGNAGGSPSPVDQEL